jgi:Asp-tRNA(Asn)/Glu-tRNA(Gln) amidotransferase A subunit family amidase
VSETLEGLAAELENGQASSVGLVERAFERIEASDSRLNSFVALDRSGALAAAKESDERRSHGRAHSQLDGIPISVKDNLHVAGFPTTWGSRALQDYRPAKDELPIARLRHAGMIVVGKTNAPEFTLEGYTRNDLFGVTRNPWNPDLTPGGSSGGAAASVAAGFVPAAIGTDGGGSIRRPACHTGLVGYKPSIGRWPRADGLPAILTDFETIGSLARTVEDTLLLDAVLRGPDLRDWRSSSAPAPSWPKKAACILYIPRFGVAPVDPEVASQVEAFARHLSSMGHDVRQGEVFFDLEIAARIWHVVSRAGVAWLMAENPTYEKLAGGSARAMAEAGRKVSGADYLGALERVSAMRRHVAELFDGVDLVLTPTAAALPWPAETPYPDQIDGKTAGPRDHAIFTGWVNIAGVPALNIPTGSSRSGLPIGAHLAAAFGADEQLLAFAREVSDAVPPQPLPQLEAAL